MTFWSALSSVFGFRPTPVTIFTFVAYVAILVSLLLSDNLPDVPNDTKGLSLDTAWTDLHQIARRPHPYNSHYNSRVHSYILERLSVLSTQYPYVSVVSDTISNGSWVDSAGTAVYFEGTNILAKITGSEANEGKHGRGALLLSAHYDSVSTAKGATDDGIGVVTLMQLFEYFAHHRPKQTAVFNINNGEEDWLNGAHAFLEHPWSKLASSFLNLEGAASGGRPILFRSTSTSIAKKFGHPDVPHPHANILSSDAFAQGVIRSGTDYSVYTHLPNLKTGGADFAFYKGRSKYHTKYDTIPYLVGQQKAMWSMMETALGVAKQILNEEGDVPSATTENIPEVTASGGVPSDNTQPVYFDLFGRHLIIMSLRSLVITNIVLMTAGPVLLLIMFLLVKLVIANRRNLFPRIRKRRSGILGFLRVLWKVLGFWVVLVISIIVNGVFIVKGFMQDNSMIVYSSPYTVLVAIFTLTFMVFIIFPMTPTSYAISYQKHTLVTQLYILSFVFLIVSTVGATKAGIGGGYAATVWNLLLWIGCFVTLSERAIYDGFEGAEAFRELGADAANVDSETPDPPVEPGVSPRRVFGEGARVDPSPHVPAERDLPPPPIDAVTERTPLLDPSVPKASGSSASSTKDYTATPIANDDGRIGWWLLQYVLIVPMPVILVGHIGLIVLTGMNQGLADGSPALLVYASASLLAHLFVLPLAPFIPQLRKSRFTLFFLLLVFLVSTIWSMTAFPFDSTAPLKVFFQQKVIYPTASILDSDTVPAAGKNLRARTTTRLTGVMPYIRSAIVPSIPSSHGKTVECSEENPGQEGGRKIGLTTCQWDSGLKMVPSPGDPTKSTSLTSSLISPEDDPVTLTVDAPPYFEAHITRVNDTLFRFLIAPHNSKGCRIYFTEPDPVGPPTSMDQEQESTIGQTVLGTSEPHQAAVVPIVTHFQTYTPSGLPPSNGGALQPGFTLEDQGIEETGIKQIRLWSRTWGRVFLVDVHTSGAQNELLKGKIACEWAEYSSGMVGLFNGEQEVGHNANSKVSSGSSGTATKIPAFEEVLDNLPEWAVTSKFADGLVEVERGFVL